MLKGTASVPFREGAFDNGFGVPRPVTTGASFGGPPPPFRASQPAPSVGSVRRGSGRPFRSLPVRIQVVSHRHAVPTLPHTPHRHWLSSGNTKCAVGWAKVIPLSIRPLALVSFHRRLMLDVGLLEL